MTGLTRTVKKKSGLTYTYSCYTCSRKGRDRSCQGKNIDADMLEKYLKDFMLERILHPFFFSDIVARIEQSTQHYSTKNIADLHKEISNIGESIENLWKMIEKRHVPMKCTKELKKTRQERRF